MKIRIYQIVLEKDKKLLAFRELKVMLRKYSCVIPAEIYQMVYEAELEAKTVEDVYYIIKDSKPVDYGTRPLCVSDVVELVDPDNGSRFYYIDPTRFQPIAFDAAKAERKPRYGE